MVTRPTKKISNECVHNVLASCIFKNRKIFKVTLQWGLCEVQCFIIWGGGGGQYHVGIGPSIIVNDSSACSQYH